MLSRSEKGKTSSNKNMKYKLRHLFLLFYKILQKQYGAMVYRLLDPFDIICKPVLVVLMLIALFLQVETGISV